MNEDSGDIVIIPLGASHEYGQPPVAALMALDNVLGKWLGRGYTFSGNFYGDEGMRVTRGEEVVYSLKRENLMRTAQDSDTAYGFFIEIIREMDRHLELVDSGVARYMEEPDISPLPREWGLSDSQVRAFMGSIAEAYAGHRTPDTPDDYEENEREDKGGQF